MTLLYFVRHAQSHPSSDVPHGQWPLSKTGAAQAAALAPLLDPLGIEHIVSSPFRRCIDTITPFAERTGLDIAEHSDLRERLIAPNLTDDFASIWDKSWRDFSFALPGCESSAIAQRRFARAIVSISKANAGSTLAVSTHGNVFGLFLNYIDESNGKFETEMLRNPDVARLVCKNGHYTWDRDFRLAGLENIATHHSETPLDMREN